MARHNIGLGFVPQRRPEVLAVDVGGETLLHDEATHASHRLDPIGALVWSRFDGTTTLAEHSRQLAEAFATEREVIERDVLRLTRQLGRQGLLVGLQGDHDHRHAYPAGSGHASGPLYVAVPPST